MRKRIVVLIVGMALVFLSAGCNALGEAMLWSQGTVSPPPPAAVDTPTPLPALGELEPLDAAYCMEPAPDSRDPDYSVLRFFPSGVVLHVTVQEETRGAAWERVAPYLKESATDTFSHGEYQYSQGQIRFALAPPKSDEMAGTVVGRIESGKMILQQQGSEMIYYLVYGGEVK